MRGEYPKGGSDIPRVFGGRGESSVTKTWANSSTSLKIISCPPKYEFAPQMRPQILKPGRVEPPLVRGSGLPSPGFYPEISGFFEAVGIFFNFYF
jgi:hypothetical protein